MLRQRHVVDRNAIHAFGVRGDKRSFMPGSVPSIEKLDGVVRGVGENALRVGFKIVFFAYQTDSDNTLTKLNAKIDVYYVPPSYLIGHHSSLKLGSFDFAGKLTGAGDKQEWKVDVVSNCLYNPRNAGQLPAEVQQIGPAAFITGVGQALFGTKTGMEMLGLGEYRVAGSD